MVDSLRGRARQAHYSEGCQAFVREGLQNLLHGALPDGQFNTSKSCEASRKGRGQYGTNYGSSAAAERSNQMTAVFDLRCLERASSGIDAELNVVCGGSLMTDYDSPRCVLAGTTVVGVGELSLRMPVWSILETA